MALSKLGLTLKKIWTRQKYVTEYEMYTIFEHESHTTQKRGSCQFILGMRTVVTQQPQRLVHLLLLLAAAEHDGCLRDTCAKLLGSPQGGDALLPVCPPVTHHTLKAGRLWGRAARGGRYGCSILFGWWFGAG